MHIGAGIEENVMAEEHRGRSHEGRGGFQRRNNWRDSGDRSWRGRDDRGRSDRSGGHRSDRSGGYDASRSQSDRRSYTDRGQRSYDRSDRSNSRDDRFDGGYRREQRYSRSEGRRGYDRGQRNDGGFNRDRQRSNWRDDDRRNRRDGDWNRDSDRRRSDRDDRSQGRGQRFDRSGGRGRDDRRQGGNDRFSGRRDERRGQQRSDDREYQNFSSTDEYVSLNSNEPTIPAGVSADELDAQATRALATLSGPNKDIVARHLVMAGQLIDLDPEEAYKHAAAASARAGRVDVVREATALTAYASGRYEEALREVRAVRRMRGDDSLRAVEADCERGLGHPDKAVDIIDQTQTQGMDLAEQVELVLVSSGARADLGQNEVGLLIVDDALAQLPADTDVELIRRLMFVKVDRLRELGRTEEADEVDAQIPDEIDDPDIVDVSLFADADVDNKRTALRGMDTPLVEAFDGLLLDLDGTAWAGDEPLEYASATVLEARAQGLTTAFVTNNAMRTPQMVADKLNTMGFEADASMIMTSAMDVIAIMKENIDDGSKVFVIGGAGLHEALTDAGYTIVGSADDEPVAVVQGLDKDVNWTLLTEGAYAIQRGAQFFATNLDATLPQERGFALGNGALVRAIQHATHKRPVAAGKPEPGIYLRGAQLVGSENPIAIGDRLETDIMGAVAAGIPSMHVLTGVHGARDIIIAPRGQRPSFLALDMRGLLEAHPYAKHHRDGTWTCGTSQVAKVTRFGVLSLDGVELTEDVTVTLDSYRALAAAAWEYADDKGAAPKCPVITVVDNENEAGIVLEPEEGAFNEDDAELGAQADELDEALDTPAFLPGEEELERLLDETAGLESDDDE